MTGVNCLSDNLKILFWNLKTALFRLVYIYSKCKVLKTDITFSFLSFKWLDCCACATGLSPTNVTLFWASQIPNQTKRVRQTISLSTFTPFAAFRVMLSQKLSHRHSTIGSFLFWLSKSAQYYHLEKAMTDVQDVQREAKTLGTPLLTRMIQKSLERTLKRIYTCV